MTSLPDEAVEGDTMTHERSGRRQWEEPGAFEVLDGVHRIPMPLPGDGLRAVNVYALEQGDGDLVLIDAGWALGNSQGHLEAALAELGHDLASVRRILVTHIHRDHYELAMRIRRWSVAESSWVRTSATRCTNSSTRSTGTTAASSRDSAGRVRSPFSTFSVANARARPKRANSTCPAGSYPDRWLQDRQVIELAGRRLEVVATPGHTRGHVVFFDHAAELLFAGDHVLPHITPSIAFERVPRDGALRDFLASLALVRSYPDFRLLPAHGPVEDSTHTRIDELFVHHDHRLNLSAQAVDAEGATAYEVATRLTWTRRETPFSALDVFNQMLAVNETAAHLDLLVHASRLGSREEDGLRHYVP